jgi:hypothetical protein
MASINRERLACRPFGSNKLLRQCAPAFGDPILHGVQVLADLVRGHAAYPHSWLVRHHATGEFAELQPTAGGCGYRITALPQHKAAAAFAALAAANED